MAKCTFSTSQLPKALPTWGVLYILTSKCASRHNGVQFFISHLVRWLRTRCFSEPTFRHPQTLEKHSVSRLFCLSLLWSSFFFSSLYLCFSIKSTSQALGLPWFTTWPIQFHQMTIFPEKKINPSSWSWCPIGSSRPQMNKWAQPQAGTPKWNQTGLGMWAKDVAFLPTKHGMWTWDVNMGCEHVFTRLTGAKGWEWMGMDGNGWEWRNGIIESYCGSFPHSLLSTKLERLSKQIEINDATWWPDATIKRPKANGRSKSDLRTRALTW